MFEHKAKTVNEWLKKIFLKQAQHVFITLNVQNNHCYYLYINAFVQSISQKFFYTPLFSTIATNLVRVLCNDPASSLSPIFCLIKLNKQKSHGAQKTSWTKMRTSNYRWSGISTCRSSTIWRFSVNLLVAGWSHDLRQFLLLVHQSW